MSYDSSAFCLSSFLADPNGKDMEGLEIENLISQATNANSQMGDPCSACDASTHGGGRAQKFPAHNVKALVGGNGCVDLPMPETSPPTVTNPPPTAPAATTSVGASLVALGAVSASSLPTCPYDQGWRTGLTLAQYTFDKDLKQRAAILTDTEWKLLLLHLYPPNCPKCCADKSQLKGSGGSGAGKRRYYSCQCCGYTWSENRPSVIYDTNMQRAQNLLVDYEEFIFSAKYEPYDCTLLSSDADIAKKEAKEDRSLGRRPKVRKPYKGKRPRETDVNDNFELDPLCAVERKVPKSDARPQKPWGQPRSMFSTAEQASTFPMSSSGDASSSYAASSSGAAPGAASSFGAASSGTISPGVVASSGTISPGVVASSNIASYCGVASSAKRSSSSRPTWSLQATMDKYVWKHFRHDMAIEDTKKYLEYVHDLWDDMGTLPSHYNGHAIDIMFYSALSRFFYEDNNISEERKLEISQLTDMSEIYININVLRQNGFNGTQMMGLYSAARSLMTPPGTMTPIPFMRPPPPVSHSPALNSPTSPHFLRPVPHMQSFTTHSSSPLLPRAARAADNSSAVVSNPPTLLPKPCRCGFTVTNDQPNAIQCQGCSSWFHDDCYEFSMEGVDKAHFTRWRCESCTAAFETYKFISNTSKAGSCMCGRSYPCPPNAYDESDQWEGSNFRWINCRMCFKLMHSCCISGESLSTDEFDVGGYVCEDCKECMYL
jgi:hypothetical protein